MTPVSLFLLTIAAIFLIGILGELVFAKTGIPDVVWLILVGIFLGPVTGLVAREQLQTIAPYFGAITLVIVLFDGGSQIRIGELSSAAPRSTITALLSFVFSVAAVASVSMGASMVGFLPETWSWIHAVILGAIVGGSSSVVIMPALKSSKLAAKIQNLVNLESALTDVFCVVVTGACIKIALSDSFEAGGAFEVGSALETLGRSFGIGLGFGLIAGLLSLLALRALSENQYAYPLVLGTLLILYVIIDEFGGSAALGILTVAILVGNAPSISKVVGLSKLAKLEKGLQNTHGTITFIIKSFFFTFIGAMLGPPWDLVIFGVILGLLLLLARIPAVSLSTLMGGFSASERGLITFMMPRGMAAGVLAMLPAQAGIKGTETLPVIVFSTVFTTILIFTAGFPILKRKIAKEQIEAEKKQTEEIEQAAPLETISITEQSKPTAELQLPEQKNADQEEVLKEETPEQTASQDTADTIVDPNFSEKLKADDGEPELS